MIVALFIAGPAVVLAIMAWAVDRFLPVPSTEQQSLLQARRTEKMPTSGRIQREPARPLASSQTLDDIRLELDRAQSLQEFEPLGQALGRFERKRMKSMAEDHYPDSRHNRYVDMDVAESASQRIIFQKNGSVRVEPKPTYVRRS